VVFTSKPKPKEDDKTAPSARDSAVDEDEGGGGEQPEIPIDVVIFATGYRQAMDFLDPTIVDLRYSRRGNDVPLYKSMFPIAAVNRTGSLALVNFLQSATPLCADLQTRLYARVLKGLIKLPSIEEQQKDAFEIRQAMCARYLDRQQLRIQTGLSLYYYDDLAKTIGCYPYWSKLLFERPTAFWHAWFFPFNAIQYRLVGPGYCRQAEQWLEGLYTSRYTGVFLNGKPKNGFPTPLRRLRMYSLVLVGVFIAWLRGFSVGTRLQEHLQQNLAYAAKDIVPHSLEVGRDSVDVLAMKK